MKKISVLLGIMTVALLMAGCGAMPNLTQGETELISEYAVGVLLKYDRAHGRRLIDTSGYELLSEEAAPEEPVEEQEEPVEEEQVSEIEEPVVVDVSQDEEDTQPIASSVEQYYGIPNIMITYQGCEIADSYPPAGEGETLFFSMDATPGKKLLVLRFNAQNLSVEDQTLNMLGYGATFRVSVNGEPSKGALATMLVNDMQTYNSVIPANSSVDLVSIVEVPQGTDPVTIDFILRGGETDGTLHLQ